MKYLIYCGPGIGDLILILPMVKSIKQADKNAYVKVFTTSSKERIQITKRMFALQHFIDEVDYYSAREIGHTLKFISENGFHRFDVAFVLQYTDNQYTSIVPHHIVKLAAKKTIGISLMAKPNITYDKMVKRQQGVRIVDYPMRMLEKFNIPPCADYSDLIDKSVLKTFLPGNMIPRSMPKIALCVGTAEVSMKIDGNLVRNNAKQWGYANWKTLASRLIDAGYGVYLMGGAKERLETGQLFESLNSENLRNFIGQCSIEQSMAVLDTCDLVVGADTGLMHCAGALDVKSLTLFGCTDVKEYLPFGKKSSFITSPSSCSPCFGTAKSVTCKDIHCMNKIRVDEVYQKIQDLVNVEKQL